MSSKLLIIGLVWPEPASSAAGSRMVQLIRFFDAQGCVITFASSAERSEFSADLEPFGVRNVPVRLNDSSFDAFVRELRPDIVLFDRYVTEEQFGWRVAESAPQALRILDTEDLHCLRRERVQALKEGVPFTPERLLSGDVARREIASIYRCDLSLIISRFEMDVLRGVFKVDLSLLHYLPYLFDPLTEAEVEAIPPFDARQDFLFIGNFRHEPNADAVRYLKKAIWPEVRRRLPHAALRIYGAYTNDGIRQLHKPSEGFHVMGRAEDAQAAMRSARVMLAPLRTGAGLKGKLAEAMAAGLPAVTTEIGAEGLSPERGWHGFVTDDGQEMARCAVALYTDASLWEEKQRFGFRSFSDLFDRSREEADLSRRLSILSQDLAAHRRRNFTGAMLSHHTTASYKYLSKWIEEKNSHRN